MKSSSQCYQGSYDQLQPNIVCKSNFILNYIPEICSYFRRRQILSTAICYDKTPSNKAPSLSHLLAHEMSDAQSQIGPTHNWWWLDLSAPICLTNCTAQFPIEKSVTLCNIYMYIICVRQEYRWCRLKIRRSSRFQCVARVMKTAELRTNLSKTHKFWRPAEPPPFESGSWWEQARPRIPVQTISLPLIVHQMPHR